MSYASIVALLKTAILLLSLAQGPNVPQALHDQAVNVAHQAINAATLALAGGSMTTTPALATSTLASTNPLCKPFPEETLILPCAEGQVGKTIKKRVSSCILNAANPTWSDWQTQSNTCQDAALLTRGWDSGLTQRRVAFYKVSTSTGTSTSTYFESCPDTPGGCFNNGHGLPIGGGFYTLSPDVGGNTPCKINSYGAFPVAKSDGTTRSETCPFLFSWLTDQKGKLAAKITVDSSYWTNPFTPYMHIGFQDHMPQGMTLNAFNYFGSKELPLIDDAHTDVDLSGLITFPVADASRARFLAGISWYVPSQKKTYVVELNLNNASNTYVETAWDTSAQGTLNTSCPQDQTCLYVGGKNWGFDPVSASQSTYTIDWSAIVSKLVTLGLIPKEAFGPYQTSSIYFEPEVQGRAKAQLIISNVRTYVQ